MLGFEWVYIKYVGGKDGEMEWSVFVDMSLLCTGESIVYTENWYGYDDMIIIKRDVIIWEHVK